MKSNREVVRSVPMNKTHPDKSGVKALIIDDETDICFLLSNILRQRNIHSTIAGSLTEAEKLLKTEHDFSFIFLDNHLPDGFGICHIRELKHLNPEGSLVMITAHDAISDREKAAKNGADDFIGKPFSSEIINNTIDKFSA